MQVIFLTLNKSYIMKYLLSFFLFVLLSLESYSQYNFDPSLEHPFGLPNPEAPKEILDFAPLIGECNCTSVKRKSNQAWTKPTDMIWRFKYIMNGMAVQDETLKSDGKHSGSIRQFIADSSKWYVHYYSSGAPTTKLPAWEGNKNNNGNIVLYKEQSAPNGAEGFYRLTFYEINKSGYKWIGEWVSKDESISFPTWKIECIKIKVGPSDHEKEKIILMARKFSESYINEDYETLVNIYTSDAKIFPNNTKIIEGTEAIKKRWQLAEGYKVLHHQIIPNEIKFIGDYAYDYGYYEGKTQNPNKSISEWKGKYVVLWKKIEEDWKMYLDIWNSVRD